MVFGDASERGLEDPFSCWVDVASVVIRAVRSCRVDRRALESAMWRREDQVSLSLFAVRVAWSESDVCAFCL